MGRQGLVCIVVAAALTGAGGGVASASSLGTVDASYGIATEVASPDAFNLQTGTTLADGTAVAISDGSLVAEDPAGTGRSATFGSGGEASVSIPGYSLQLVSAARDASGRIVVAGSATSAGQSYPAVVRLTPSGALDPSFDPGGSPAGVVVDTGLAGADLLGVALDGQGRVLVAGNRGTSVVVGRLTEAGDLDPAFNPGSSTPGFVVLTAASGHTLAADAIAVGTDDAPVVAGALDHAAPMLLRVSSAGAFDSGFGGQGGLVTESLGLSSAGGADVEATHVALDSSGRIYALARGYGTSVTAVVARFTPAGALDSGYGNGGVAALPGPAGQMLSEGFVVRASGSTAAFGQLTGGSVVIGALDPSGQVDTAFNASGAVPGALVLPTGPGASYGRGLALDPQGNLVAFFTGAQPAQTARIFDDLPPQAVIAGPPSGAAGQPLTFDGSRSTDREGPLTYAWHFTDATTTDATTEHASHVFSTPGPHTISLTVTDSAGATATDTATVDVTPSPSTPGAAASVVTGPITDRLPQEVTLTGHTDAGPGTMSWHFDYGKDTGYGNATATVYGAKGSADVSRGIAQLDPATTYHYRLVGVTDAGALYGDDRTFTTPPDDRIAFVRDFDIYSLYSDGTDLRQVTDRSAPGARCHGFIGPTWSPDGTRIAALCKAATVANRRAQDAIVVMNKDGSGQRVLPSMCHSYPYLGLNDVNTWCSPPSWRPDGGQLAYAGCDSVPAASPDDPYTVVGSWYADQGVPLRSAYPSTAAQTIAQTPACAIFTIAPNGGETAAVYRTDAPVVTVSAGLPPTAAAYTDGLTWDHGVPVVEGPWAPHYLSDATYSPDGSAIAFHAVQWQNLGLAACGHCFLGDASSTIDGYVELDAGGAVAPMSVAADPKTFEDRLNVEEVVGAESRLVVSASTSVAPGNPAWLPDGRYVRPRGCGGLESLGVIDPSGRPVEIRRDDNVVNSAVNSGGAALASGGLADARNPAPGPGTQLAVSSRGPTSSTSPCTDGFFSGRHTDEFDPARGIWIVDDAAGTPPRQLVADGTDPAWWTGRPSYAFPLKNPYAYKPDRDKRKWIVKPGVRDPIEQVIRVTNTLDVASRFARPTILGGGGAFRLAPIRQAAVRAATAADPPPCADSVVAAHAACSIGVLFDPKVVGTVTAYLQFGGSADPQAGIPLAGTGTLARPALTVARLSRTTVGAKAAAGLSLVLRTNFAGHGLLSVVPYACAVDAAVDRTSTHRCKGIVERPFTISAGRQRMRLRLHLRPGRYHVAVAAVPSRGGSRPLGRRMTLRVTR